MAAVAVYAVGLLLRLPGQLNQDGWLTLLSGREVASRGLPHYDTLTVWAHGVPWVDQQWLAQLGFYGLFAVGGIPLVALAYAALTVGAFAAVLVLARRLGASSLAILCVVPLTAVPAVWGSWQFRAQSLAFPLFAALLWILAADSRAPSRRVLLALPLLVLWANVHGSVVLAALLVVLRGLSFSVESWRAGAPSLAWMPRAAALLAAPLCVLASPYGSDLVGYYHRTLLNPAFAQVVGEWRPTELHPFTAPFFVVSGLAVFLVGRYRGRLTAFETLALLVLVISGLGALRNVIWFALAATALVPVALEGALAGRRPSTRKARVNVVVGLGSVVLTVAVVAVTASRPAGWFEQRYEREAANVVARAAAQRPDALVFSDERDADWLLWLHPELRGRVALDARFELLSAPRLEAMFDFRNHQGDWRRAARNSDLLVLSPRRDGAAIRTFLREPGARKLYAGPSVVVISRDVGRRS